MNRNVVVAVLSLNAVVACATANEAKAQCSTSCNTLTDTMVRAGDWSGPDRVRIGMIVTSGQLRPAACNFIPGFGWILSALGPRAYPGPMTVDTSLCTGDSGDIVDFAGANSNGSAQTQCRTSDLTQTFDLFPLTVGQAHFSVSGEGGRDWIDATMIRTFLLVQQEVAYICGGADNDTLFGSLGDDYISGQEGSDYIDGQLGADNLKAASGNDVLRTRNTGLALADKLRGEGGNDCFWVDEPISSASTSGPESGDRYRRASSSIAVPEDCNSSTPDCCAWTGAACP